MKSFLRITALSIAIFACLICFSACENGTDGKDGQNGKSAYELAVENGFEGTLDEWLELLKCKDNNQESENSFIPGDNVACTAGETFKLPINGQNGEFVTISSIKVTKLKEADINNIDDYWTSGSSCYYARYIYEVHIIGSVDIKFVGEQIYVNLSFGDGNTINNTKNPQYIEIDESGKFDVTYKAYDNQNVNYVIPNSAYISPY